MDKNTVVSIRKNRADDLRNNKQGLASKLDSLTKKNRLLVQDLVDRLISKQPRS